MDKKQLYTSLSRTTQFDYIHLDNKTLNRNYYNRQIPPLELINSKFTSLYKNSKIYQITFNKNNYVYVGSTCEDIEIRLKWHIKNKNSQIYKYKDDIPQISLIINAPCNDRKKLLQIENGYITSYAKKYQKLLLNQAE